MSEQKVITYCKKPENISFDDIHELLWQANSVNREKGFVLATSEMSGKELEERIGPEGTTIVALDGDKLVGTLSVHPGKGKRWYNTGKTAGLLLNGVLPDYQGLHITSTLFKTVLQLSEEEGCVGAELDTADNNDHAIEIFRHMGFREVAYKANPGRDHYSVLMMKWFGKCPFSPAYISFRYHLQRTLVRLRYTPDKKKRFGI